MFEKNLQYIDNEALKRRLARLSIYESRIGIAYCITPSNDYILLKDDVPSDDLNNPRQAISKMLETNIRSEMAKNDIIIEFGIGLGYLLDETFNRYPSKIYIYEPDLKLLHFVLNNVDISEHLASGRVYITNDLDELINKLSSTYITKDKVEVVYLQNYAVVRNKEMLMLSQRVYDTCKSKMIDVNTIQKFSGVWLENSINNIADINNNRRYLLSSLSGLYSGQTAIVAGAGPSLSDNIAYLQANRNKYILIAVNKSVRYLMQNGITPDFVVCLDARNMDTTLGGLESSLGRVNCIMDLRSDSSLMNKPFSKIFINFSESDTLAKKLHIYNKFINYSITGGTASTLALMSAIKMGFSKIVLAGVDLAYKGNIAYANGDVFNRISQEEVLADGVKKNLVMVPSVTGEMVYTRDDYQNYIKHFKELIKDFNYNEVYNISSFGANIPGTKNVSFEDLKLFAPAIPTSLDNIEPFTINVKEFMEEEFSYINEVISLLSSGTFSPALVSSITKSVLLYQFMQSEIVSALQKNFEADIAEDFITKTKAAIKTVVELLQRNKLI